MESGRGARWLAAVLILGAGGVVAFGVAGAMEAGVGEQDATAGAIAPATAAAAATDGSATAPLVTVWKSPTCGCCDGWVEHLREEGFTVEVEEVSDPRELSAVKAEMGITANLASCHTARIGDVVVEGHVPADAIRRFLALEEEERGGRGLAVPGMPIGSPGMEIPGRSAEPYEILAFGDDGAVRVFEER